MSKAKKAVVFALIVIIAGMLAACSMQKEGAIAKGDGVFQRAEHYEWQGDVIVDTETGVMYWVSRGSYSSGVLTMLKNADGSPKVYDAGEE